MQLNAQTASICQHVMGEPELYRIASFRDESGATILDFGVQALGGIQAGILLAEICMGGCAEVHLLGGAMGRDTYLQVVTDDPVIACMAAQYAGWPVQCGKFYAMGSGPMRIKRGREPVLVHLGWTDDSDQAVGVLECDRFPDAVVCKMIAEECHVSPDRLMLCVAPTKSIAGTIQVVARSIETCLHQMFELGFDLRQIVSATGTVPLPPPAVDFVKAIGRTNDAILYGGEVNLWVRASDEAVADILSSLPSQASRDWGKPFAEIFKQYDGDFYQVDPRLFAPAVVQVCNLSSGKSWKVGTLRPDVLAVSFGTEHLK